MLLLSLVNIGVVVVVVVAAVGHGKLFKLCHPSQEFSFATERKKTLNWNHLSQKWHQVFIMTTPTNQPTKPTSQPISQPASQPFEMIYSQLFAKVTCCTSRRTFFLLRISFLFLLKIWIHYLKIVTRFPLLCMRSCILNIRLINY